jgi:hypothetical protein
MHTASVLRAPAQVRCAKDTLLGHSLYGPSAFSLYTKHLPPDTKRVFACGCLPGHCPCDRGFIMGLQGPATAHAASPLHAFGSAQIPAATTSTLGGLPGSSRPPRRAIRPLPRSALPVYAHHGHNGPAVYMPCDKLVEAMGECITSRRPGVTFHVVGTQPALPKRPMLRPLAAASAVFRPALASDERNVATCRRREVGGLCAAGVRAGGVPRQRVHVGALGHVGERWPGLRTALPDAGFRQQQQPGPGYSVRGRHVPLCAGVLRGAVRGRRDGHTARRSACA